MLSPRADGMIGKESLDEKEMLSLRADGTIGKEARRERVVVSGWLLIKL